MAAEVKGQGLRQAPRSLHHHLPCLSQFYDRSVVQKWDLMGQLWLYFWSRLFIKKVISPTPSPFTILETFSLFYFPFFKHKMLRILNCDSSY